MEKNRMILPLSADDKRVQEARSAERRLYSRYGLCVKEHEVPVPGLGLRVRVCEVGQGEPVLMVPGNTGDSFPFVPLMAQLQGKRMLAVNRPGGGLSEGFDHHSVPFRRLATETLAAVLDYFGLESVPVISHSMGSHWSLWFAMDCPARVQRLALLGVPGNVMGCCPPLPLRLASVPGAGRFLFRFITPRSPCHALRGLSFMGHPQKTLAALPPEMQDCYYAFQLLPNYRAASLSLMEVTNTLRGSVPGIRITEQALSRVAQPVLLVWGQNDPFGSVEEGEKIARALPCAEWMLIENGGHLPWLDAPQHGGEAILHFFEGL